MVPPELSAPTERSNDYGAEELLHNHWINEMIDSSAPPRARDSNPSVTVAEPTEKESPKLPDLVIDPTGLEIRLIGGSPAFQKRELDLIESIPDVEKKYLHDFGVKFAVVSKVIDFAPELANQKPRGWPEGTTWADSDGAYIGDERKAVVLAEETRSGISPRHDGVNRHESAHALDYSLGLFSNSKEFRQAYDQDLARLSDEQKRQMWYLMQPGAGREETFAEIQAGLNGGTADIQYNAFIMRSFPAVKALVAKEEAELIATGTRSGTGATRTTGPDTATRAEIAA